MSFNVTEQIPGSLSEELSLFTAAEHITNPQSDEDNPHQTEESYYDAAK